MVNRVRCYELTSTKIGKKSKRIKKINGDKEHIKQQKTFPTWE